MNAEQIASLPKNKLEEIRIALLKTNKIDLRTYFYFPDSPEPRPTRKGVLLLPKHTEPIVKALSRAAANDKEEVFVEFDLKEKEKLRAYTAEYMKAKLFHIRTFYFKDGDFHPGKGISFQMELAPKVLEALKTAGAKQKAA